MKKAITLLMFAALFQLSFAQYNGGGTMRGENEFILKQNTKYLFRITSEAADNDISTTFGFYEHANKN